jgi:peptidoglycan/LPS O-acetylase OafA/YrhL
VWVAVIMHLTHYLDEKLYQQTLIASDYVRLAVLEGVHGMHLFFMISGFILSLPFARMHLKHDEKLNLSRYYLRRLTRLEPPYLIALLIFFLLHVFIVQKYPAGELFSSLGASAIYLHDILKGAHSYILPVAWSLEIEVQFYLVAPLLCLVFMIRKPIVRKLVLISGIVLFFILSYRLNQVLALHSQLHYFLCGLLLTEFYLEDHSHFKSSGFITTAGMVILLLMLTTITYEDRTMTFLKMILMFLFFYGVLVNDRLKKIFSARWMTLIGGMCYSLYLLHYGIISAAGYFILQSGVPQQWMAPVYFLLIGSFILVLSSIYFLLVEKPFMKLKISKLNWHRITRRKASAGNNH